MWIALGEDDARPGACRRNGRAESSWTTSDDQHVSFADDRRFACGFGNYCGCLWGHVANLLSDASPATCLLQAAGHDALDVVALQKSEEEDDRQAGNHRRGEDEVPVHDLVAVEAGNSDLDDPHRRRRGDNQGPDERVPTE